MVERAQEKQRQLSTSIRVIGQWLDSDFRREEAPNPESLPDQVNWERTLPFIFLHLGCLAVFLVGFSSYAAQVGKGTHQFSQFHCAFMAHPDVKKYLEPTKLPIPLSK